MSDERDSPVDRPATCRTGKVLKADSIGEQIAPIENDGCVFCSLCRLKGEVSLCKRIKESISHPDF